MEYLDLFFNAFLGTLDWTWRSICFDVPWTRNYFWGLVVISLIIWGLELLFPWRKQQAILRKDFFLDGFYMFFNFFIFSIFISGFYKIISKIAIDEFNISANSIAIINLSSLSPLVQLLLFFVVLDFVQWVTHIFMHRFSFLWRFHKVHHSVKEMGFAAHLRYHWMENIVYKPFKVIALMLMGGFQPEQAFIVHFIAISIGHLNHSNIKLDYGPFKYLFNNTYVFIRQFDHVRIAYYIIFFYFLNNSRWCLYRNYWSRFWRSYICFFYNIPNTFFFNSFSGLFGSQKTM